jgi:hypothetical protein
MNRADLIRRFLVTVAALGVALPVAAQTPRVEVSGGYQFLNVSADLRSNSWAACGTTAARTRR